MSGEPDAGVEADGGVARAESDTRETVGVLLKSIAAPHEGQKRLLSGVRRLHAEQIMRAQCNTRMFAGRVNFVAL